MNQSLLRSCTWFCMLLSSLEKIQEKLNFFGKNRKKNSTEKKNYFWKNESALGSNLVLCLVCPSLPCEGIRKDEFFTEKKIWKKFRGKFALAGKSGVWIFKYKKERERKNRAWRTGHQKIDHSFGQHFYGFSLFNSTQCDCRVESGLTFTSKASAESLDDGVDFCDGNSESAGNSSLKGWGQFCRFLLV